MFLCAFLSSSSSSSSSSTVLCAPVNGPRQWHRLNGANSRQCEKNRHWWNYRHRVQTVHIHLCEWSSTIKWDNGQHTHTRCGFVLFLRTAVQRQELNKTKSVHSSVRPVALLRQKIFNSNFSFVACVMWMRCRCHRHTGIYTAHTDFHRTYCFNWINTASRLDSGRLDPSRTLLIVIMNIEHTILSARRTTRIYMLEFV